MMMRKKKKSDRILMHRANIYVNKFSVYAFRAEMLTHSNVFILTKFFSK